MTLAEATLQVARGYLGVREVGGPNRGPDVEKFLAYVHRPPGESWCAAFVSFCVAEAARTLVRDIVGPPLFRPSAGALKLLDINPGLRLSRPEPGCIFIIDHGGGYGHCGLVESIVTETGHAILRTVEGNTGPGPAVSTQDRNGDGVYERSDRRSSDCCGFLAIR